jgi:hypothetical protein
MLGKVKIKDAALVNLSRDNAAVEPTWYIVVTGEDGLVIWEKMLMGDQALMEYLKSR